MKRAYTNGILLDGTEQMQPEAQARHGQQPVYAHLQRAARGLQQKPRPKTPCDTQQRQRQKRHGQQKKRPHSHSMCRRPIFYPAGSVCLTVRALPEYTPWR